MQHNAKLDLFDLELLRQLFGAATHEASAAMCRWTNGLVTLSLDEVVELPLEEVSAALGFGEELMTMVVLTLEGGPEGEMILAFDEVNGRHLAGSLLGRTAQAEGPWTDLEISAIKETGNILSCAYFNALTRLLGIALVPSPPEFLQDFGISVLEQALASQALSCDRVLVCQTRFQREAEKLNWSVLFLPHAQLREAMDEALRATI